MEGRRRQRPPKIGPSSLSKIPCFSSSSKLQRIVCLFKRRQKFVSVFKKSQISKFLKRCKKRRTKKCTFFAFRKRKDFETTFNLFFFENFLLLSQSITIIAWPGVFVPAILLDPRSNCQQFHVSNDHDLQPLKIFLIQLGTSSIFHPTFIRDLLDLERKLFLFFSFQISSH